MRRSAGRYGMLLGALILLALVVTGSPPTVRANGPAPSVDSLSPLSGPTAGGATVTVSGSDFNGTVTVTFGGLPATSFNEVSGTTITATAPAHAAGTVDVIVIAAGGTSANTAADDFTYIDAGVLLTEAGGSTLLTEGGGAAEHYSLVLTAVPLSTVTINVLPDSQVTTDRASLTFTTGNWSDAQTVAVNAVDDGVVEGAHFGTIQHAATGGGYDGVPIVDVVATITDNDVASVVIVQSGGSTDVTEGGAGDTYTVALSAMPAAPISIVVNGTSQAIASPSSLTFTTVNWSIAQIVTVSAVDDAVQEGPHASTISHTASGPGFDGLAIDNVIVNISDNDTVSGQILLTHSGETTDVAESGGSDSYTVRLSLEPSGPVAVAVMDGTLQVLVDQAALFFTTTNWNVAQTVTVTAVDDQIVEGPHVVGIQHFATGGGYDGIPAATLGVSISDNDVAGVIIPAAGAERLTFTPIDDAWIGPDDPTKNHGDDNRIEVDQSPVKEGLLRFNVSGIAGRAVLDATLRLHVRNGSPGGGRFVGAAHNVWQEETVTWNTAPAASVPFLGQLGSVSSGQTVELDASQLVTGDGLVTVRILATSSNRVEFASKEDQGGALAPELIVDLAPTPAPAVTEGGVGDTYTIRLASQPLANVTIVILPDADLVTSPTQLVFTSANWNVLRIVTVSAVDDDETEGAHTAQISHTAIWPGATGVNVPNVTVMITDNDLPSLVVTETGNGTAVVEGGVGDTVRVALGAKPSGPVTVRFSSGGELAASPSTLTFTTANWQTPQTLQIIAVDDDLVEGEHGDIFTLTASGGGFGEGVLATVFTTIGDNDFVERISLQQGLELIGWFGLPTTTRAILDSNPRIVTIWVWVGSTQSWLVDSDELPQALRLTIVIKRGQGLFIVSSRATTLEVTVAG